jgi:hypothetical protein
MNETTEPTAKDREWVLRELAAIPVAPVRRAARSSPVDPAFAASVRQQFRKRDAEIAALRTELRELRAEIGVARKLDELGARIDRLEASPRSGLRAVSS